MSDFRVVYDSPNKCDYLFIKKYLKRKAPVWVIEPFHAYHHNKGIRFFPPYFPTFVRELILDRKVSVLRADEINAKEIYPLAADKAVDVVEAVYPKYRKRFDKIISYVSDTLKSPIAENAFRKVLCDKLAEYYSVNILLHRIEKHLYPGPIVVYPDINVYSYLLTKELLSESNQENFEHPNIRFPVQTHVIGFLENLKQNLTATVKLFAQTVVSALLGRQKQVNEKKKKAFSYGITVMGQRQLQGNERGPDFVIDNKDIYVDEVVYFPAFDLTKKQQKILARLPGKVYNLPKIGQFFSHYPQWKKLLVLAVQQQFLRNGVELMSASNAFFNYFRWQQVLQDVSMHHFITHADFGISHLGRNLALNQAGIQTWYFTDSSNLGVNLRTGEKCSMHHPFWTYLYYDHFVTWNDKSVKFYKEHPGSFKQSHVVGCLWSGHIREKNQARKEATVTAFRNLNDYYLLSCFDSTYSRNGLTSYTEGIAFAIHLLQLAEEYPDIHIFLKEKKDRSIHHILDPVNGPKLIEIYNEMDAHPRITICNNRADASELISVSDMVISYPFTSTTFEALSTNRPAIWHDPMGYYQDTPYGNVGGVTTHSYDELKARVLEIKAVEEGEYKNPIPADSPLMDPYRDGKAIDRFRDLLCRHDGG